MKVNDSCAEAIFLTIGVPQGSILGPLLFILYTRDLEKIAAKYGFSIHLYADDTQIYFAFNPAKPLADHLKCLSSCFADIQNWMSGNFLKLNGDKTEIMVVKSSHSMYNNLTTFDLGPGVSITKSESAKNLGFYFDSNLSLSTHLNNITRVCYMN